MSKPFIFLCLIFFSGFVFSHPSLRTTLIAQEDSFFDDSDLEDIESFGDSDEESESPLNEFDNSSADDNFIEDDFEFVEGEGEESPPPEESGNIYEGDDEGDRADYEIISDKPDYEVVEDEELEQEFQEGDSPGEDNLEEGPEESDQEEGEQSSSTDEPAGGVGETIEEIDSLEEESEAFPIEDSTEGEMTEALGDTTEDLGETSDTEELDEGDLPPVADLEEAGFSEESLNIINNIRYIAEQDQIVIDCSEPTSHNVRKNEETHQLIIEILQARLGSNLQWPFVLRDFNTNFGLVQADQKDSSTVRIVIQLKESGDFPITQLTEEGNQLIVGYNLGEEDQAVSSYEGISSDAKADNIPLPPVNIKDFYFGNFEFTGTPISFHVIDAPIKQVLRFISEESGLNMVIGESVTGKITLKLEDVPWDQALYTIFKVKSLGYTRDGNIMIVLPLAEIEQRTKKLKEISDQQKGLSPYETKVIPISYGKLSDIEAKVKDFLTPSTNLSKGGKIITHLESNTFVVIDTAEALQKIESLIEYLDRPPKQVLVEAKIVEVAESFARNLGLTWGLSGDLPVSINTSGFAEFTQSLLGNISGAYGGRFSNGTLDSSLSLSGLPLIGDIGASLNLAESEGYAEVISTPKVVVISGKAASITRNTPILVPSSTTSTTTAEGSTSSQESVQKEDVSISLNVTPTVTATGSVFLTVDVTRSDPGGRGGSFKTTRNAKTEVLVKNGQTIVVGGIYEQDTVEQNDGLPFIKNIPFLNFLFNTRGRNRSKAELLVFITPKLVGGHE